MTAYERRISDGSPDVCSSDPQGAGGEAQWCRAIGEAGLDRYRRSAGGDTVGQQARRADRRCGDVAFDDGQRRSEARRVGQRASVRVELGGSGIIKKKSQYKTRQPLANKQTQKEK